MAKPAEPRWARTAGGADGNIGAGPSGAHQDDGWNSPEKPVDEDINWVLNKIYRWVVKFIYGEIVTVGHDDLGAHRADVIDTIALAPDAVETVNSEKANRIALQIAIFCFMINPSFSELKTSIHNFSKVIKRRIYIDRQGVK